MRNFIILICMALLTACQTKPKDLPSDFVLGKGTNLAHWLSQSQARGEQRAAFITEKDIEDIASLGFQHVRLPIDEEQMWDTTGARHPEAFALMDSCITWSIRNKLCVIVDLHILRSHHFNHSEKPLWTKPEAQEQFFGFWRDLSAELHEYPLSKVAYELMNEAVADDHEQWNVLLKKCYSAIRKLEPERIIVIGSNRWQSVDTFDALKVPENDSNIILSFHFYEPFLLTHYTAPWTNIKDYEGAVHYPGIILKEEEIKDLPENELAIAKDWVGREFNKEILAKMMQKPMAKAKELGLPLYCGEYGVFINAPEEDRLRWYKDMEAIFSENGIGSANWNYKSDQFGIINRDGSKNQELIDAILGK